MKYMSAILELQNTALHLKEEMIKEASNKTKHSQLEDAYFEIRTRIKSLVKKGERK
jgi:hypothetical protein